MALDYELDMSEIIENLDKLESLLLNFEKQLLTGAADTTDIHITFRHAHNLKSLLAIAQKPLSSMLIHAIESAFDLVRKGEESINAALAEKSLDAVDLIRNNIENNREVENEINNLIFELKNVFAKIEKKKSNDSFLGFELTEEQQKNLESAVVSGKIIYQIEKLIKTDISESVFLNMPIYADLKEVGLLIASFPLYENFPKSSETILKILFATSEQHEELEYIIFDPFFKIELSEQTVNDYKTRVNENKKKDKKLKINCNTLIYSNHFEIRKSILHIALQNGTCDVANSIEELVDVYENSLHHYTHIVVANDNSDFAWAEKIRKHETQKNIVGLDTSTLVAIQTSELITNFELNGSVNFIISDTQQLVDIYNLIYENINYESQSYIKIFNTNTSFTLANSFELQMKLIDKINSILLKIESNPNPVAEFDELYALLRSFICLAGISKTQQILPILCVMFNSLKLLYKNKKSHTENQLEEWLKVITVVAEYLHNNSITIPTTQSIVNNLRNDISDSRPLENTTTVVVTKTDFIVDLAAINDFVTGCLEMLEELEQLIVKLEKTENENIINDIFRIIHNLKGDAGYIGARNLSEYTHILENLLDSVRKNETVLSSSIIDVLFETSDILKNEINVIQNTQKESLSLEHIDSLREKINQLANIQNNNYQNTAPQTDLKDAYKDQISQYKEILVMAQNYIPLNENKSKVLFRALESLQNASTYVQDSEIRENTIQCIHLLNNEKNDELKLNLAKLCEIIDTTLQKFNQNTPAQLQIVNQNQQPKQDNEEIKTFRIHENKIDVFFNLIGELLTAKNTYEYLLYNSGNEHLKKVFKDNLHLFSRITNDLQSSVISLRMIPIKTLFQKLNRVVRDVAKIQGKHIELRIVGEDIEIDKKLSDTLTEPLVHLIRNACDHGIEMPYERLHNEKSEIGHVSVTATQVGSNLQIEIKDDGKGINKEKLIQKAMTLNIDVEKYNDNNVLNLIFEPGLSMKEEVTDISGRGVGMDVVNTTIQKLGGDMYIESEINVGTKMTISLPMSMGLSKNLIVEVDGNAYGIPFSYVNETMKIPPKQLQRVHDRLFINYRKNLIPAIHLNDLLTGNRTDYMTTDFYEMRNEISEVPALVINSKFGNYAILCDKFLKNMELTIKKLPDGLEDIQNINGVSILGDGRIILIVNPDCLV